MSGNENNSKFIDYGERKSRRGRLKKGEKIKINGLKTMSKEEFFNSLEQLKHKIAQKYKVFCNEYVTYEDLIGAANVGLAWAYRDWDARKAKHTTFAYNRIERAIDLYLTEALPKYKNNIDAKNWLRTKNDESFEKLKERKKTKDEEFNQEYGLDGSRPFSKELYNLYTQKVANKLFNKGRDLVINHQSAYQMQDNNDFDIFDTVAIEEEPLEYDLSGFTEEQKQIVELLIEGYKLSEISKKLGIPKYKIMKILEDKIEDY
jgi:RNA polymerase sigma factor (sigma-70 family)